MPTPTNSLELLDVMREKPNVCRYLDIALQHISDHMLDRMHRHVTKADTISLLRTIRQRVPGIHIRTTLMVGFPVRQRKTLRSCSASCVSSALRAYGSFLPTPRREGTYSALHYDDDVPEEVKQQRLDKLMALQQQISEEIEAEKVGKTFPVIIDRKG